MNQGFGWSVVSIIELKCNKVEKFGIFGTWANDCGVQAKNCGTTAYRISVKLGKRQRIYQENIVKLKAHGKYAGKSAFAEPREDTSVYRRIK